MSEELKLPLTGDVTQTILPWNWAINYHPGPLSVLNVNMGQSARPDVERALLEQVGSYGRQLGRIGEALEVLMKHVHLGHLSPAEQASMDALELQLRTVRLVKKERMRAAAPD